MGFQYDQVRESVDFLRGQVGTFPPVGLILGSGLGELAEEVEDPDVVPYGQIPGFQETSVESHAGNLVFGELRNQSICLMQGRYHYYEGYDVQELVFPIRTMWGLGIQTLLVTNASGAINRNLEVGDLVCLTDHINFLGTNPLIGYNEDDIGSRFVDMTEAYDSELGKLAHDRAEDLEVDLKKGVYLATTGPSLETPAEIRMFDTLGADLVGMSTVPEVIAANHCGMKVLGLSCVTNMAAGISDSPLDHEEVIETTQLVKDDFKDLVKSILASPEL